MKSNQGNMNTGIPCWWSKIGKFWYCGEILQNKLKLFQKRWTSKLWRTVCIYFGKWKKFCWIKFIWKQKVKWWKWKWKKSKYFLKKFLFDFRYGWWVLRADMLLSEGKGGGKEPQGGSKRNRISKLYNQQSKPFHLTILCKVKHLNILSAIK